MQPSTEIITLSFILFVISIALIVWAINTFANASDLKKDADAKYESAKEEIERLESENKKLTNRQIKSSQLPHRFGIGHMTSPDNENILVYATFITAGGNSTIVLKLFPIEDDRDFAIREAEELIDKLNEK